MTEDMNDWLFNISVFLIIRSVVYLNKPIFQLLPVERGLGFELDEWDGRGTLLKQINLIMPIQIRKINIFI